MATFYVSIGNSDDKLTQIEWHNFVAQVKVVLGTMSSKMHGAWFSLPHESWQNACWCVEFDSTTTINWAKDKLKTIAKRFGQDSIAWAEAPITEFLG